MEAATIQFLVILCVLAITTTLIGMLNRDHRHLDPSLFTRERRGRKKKNEAPLPPSDRAA